MLAYRFGERCFHSMDDVSEGVMGRSAMNVFVIAAGMMTVIHLVTGWQHPGRLPVYPGEQATSDIGSTMKVAAN